MKQIVKVGHRTVVALPWFSSLGNPLGDWSWYIFTGGFRVPYRHIYLFLVTPGKAFTFLSDCLCAHTSIKIKSPAKSLKIKVRKFCVWKQPAVLHYIAKQEMEFSY